MGKYYGTGGIKIGKIGNEKYYLNKNINVVQESVKYVPVNNAWLKKEEFKKYVLSLLQEGIPQIYVLNELPQELYPYALIFVQNGNKTSVYVDKGGVRTQINVGDGGYDAVDVTNAIPSQPRNNTVYFVNQSESKNTDGPEYDLYVCENNELKQIILKGESDPDLPHIKEVVGDITTKSLKNVYNTTLAANKNVVTSSDGYLTTANPPHLYLHSIRYDKSGTGECNFYIYNSNSSQMNTTDVYNFLRSIGANQSFTAYPASGQAYNYSIVTGIYSGTQQEGAYVIRGFYVVYHTGSTTNSNWYSTYTNFGIDTVIQIF